MKRCAIVGATGYTGQELRRLLTNHCGLEAAVLMTARPGVVPDEADIGPLDLTRYSLNLRVPFDYMSGLALGMCASFPFPSHMYTMCGNMIFTKRMTHVIRP